MSSRQVDSQRQYLENAITFLKHHQWLFNYKNTDILTKQVLGNFPLEWRRFFDTFSVEQLHDLVRGNVTEDAPEDLKKLVNEISLLTVSSVFDTNCDVKSTPKSGIKSKKSHEIDLLAGVIDEICKEAACDLVVDIGSGVGHLAQLLSTTFGYSVLGLEASAKFVETARKSARSATLFFEEMFVTESSAEEIERLIDDRFGANRKFCLVGLHACADLSAVALKLFEALPGARALVIMPCCYHRMTVSDDSGRFKYFPLSVVGTELFREHEASSFLRQPFLRLACQQALGSFVSMSYAEHRHHAEQCLFRAILEAVAQAEHCSLRRLKRKSGKSPSTIAVEDEARSFRHYLSNLPKTHRLVIVDVESSEKRVAPLVTDASFVKGMHEKWTRHKNDCWQVEVLMGLQQAIQSVCENVVLLDRVAFLEENGIHCRKRKITNDCISPRCWALIAAKDVL